MYLDVRLFRYSYGRTLLRPDSPITCSGSMCHCAQHFTLIGSMQHGACTIQPTEIAFGGAELMAIVSRYNLNRLHMFPTPMSGLITRARSDSDLLACLKQLDTLMYTGLSLPTDEQRFAHAAGLKLFVSTHSFTVVIRPLTRF